MIQGIKLLSDEGLLAEVTATVSRGDVTVKNPLVVTMSMGPKGIACDFYPWSIINDGEITINSHAIAARYDVPKSVEDNYIQNTTNLQVVSGGQASQILQG